MDKIKGIIWVYCFDVLILKIIKILFWYVFKEKVFLKITITNTVNNLSIFFLFSGLQRNFWIQDLGSVVRDIYRFLEF
jgi:hypothetical protein